MEPCPDRLCQVSGIPNSQSTHSLTAPWGAAKSGPSPALLALLATVLPAQMEHNQHISALLL